tara:strand:+ start:548 stop:721 length:174 start_codon:yes stop_codon:yes gene_type:complete
MKDVTMNDYPERLSIGLTKEARALLDTVSFNNSKSLAFMIRKFIDEGLSNEATKVQQ